MAECDEIVACGIFSSVLQQLVAVVVIGGNK